MIIILAIGLFLPCLLSFRSSADMAARAPGLAAGLGVCMLLALLFLVGGSCLVDGDRDINGLWVTPKSPVCINEVCSNDLSILVDGGARSCDYVELYNSGDTEVSLSGWHLSDRARDLTAVTLDDIIIPPYGYTLIYLGGTADDRAASVPLFLSQSGEGLYLSDPDGKLVDSVMLPALEDDQCYVRVTDGGSEWTVAYASPLACNETAPIILPQTLAAPSFDAPGGFYDESFYLTLTAGRDQTVFFTTDGSTPTMLSQPYTEPILIPYSEDPGQATVIRAIAYNANYTAESPAVCQTYFVTDTESDLFRDVYTVSLTTDERNLYDYETGILIPGRVYDRAVWELGEDEANLKDDANWTQNWKRSAHIQLFSDSGDTLLDQPVKIRTHGGWSITNDIKAFNVYAQDGCTLACDLFDDGFEPVSVVLRAGGTEGRDSILRTWLSFFKTLIRDSLFQSLAAGREAAGQEFYLCNVYINGAYYGAHVLTEKYSTNYFAGHYGIPEDAVTIVKNHMLLAGSAGGAEDRYSLETYAEEHDLSLDSEYAYIADRLNIQNFIDCICINTYIGNVDSYPYNNTYWWKAGDGKWNMALYDLDIGAWFSPQKNTFIAEEGWGSDLHDSALFMGLMENDGFKRQFVTSFMDIAQVNYAPERVEEVLIPLRDAFSASWQQATGGTAEDFDRNCQDIQDYFEKRFVYISAYLKKDFALEGHPAPITLHVSDPAAGSIHLNTTDPDLASGTWTGRYYTDYPVTVTAVPAEGYAFAGWTGSADSGEPTLELSFDRHGLELTACFIKEE